ncbi:hypothetical protein [Roseibium sediminicola]|uniref:Uncharacterized protein n=1 Tax=Roseibium sediminicola TaxID=2933272 RepID=A0ABT0GPB9_9HYPH|nr:hypothetical protein [Roseibium sp. CAU 1639]MCK7610947.1 hypothetical protein [Roseibium sp. CAU 1639]
MTNIEASEDSFSRANSFYILMWLVTSLVLLTAFLDFRSYHREVNTNDHLIDFYSGFERDAVTVAKIIRTAVYLLPNYQNEKGGVETIRKLRSSIIKKHIWLDENLLKVTSKMPNDKRIEINTSINYMWRMLLLNDAVDPDGSIIPSEPSLLLAEHEAGSYLVSEKIEDLRIEDAARYLWLSTLDLPRWSEVLTKHINALKKGSVLDDFGSDLAGVSADVQSMEHKRLRQFAEKIWKKWISSASRGNANTALEEQEIQRRVSLTLAQTSVYLKEAYQKQAQLHLRAGGQASELELPVISVSLQLRDAVLIAPWILVFCTLAIAIYTSRAIRYAPKIVSKDTVVGNVPSFYAFYGFNKVIGIGVAIILLLSPPLLLGFAVPLLLAVVIEGWVWQIAFYFGGIVLAMFLVLVTLAQIPSVLSLIDKGIIIQALPLQPFPYLGWRMPDDSDPATAVSAETTHVDVVPPQFRGCWKHALKSGRPHYLRLLADGRFFLSSGKQQFAISNDGTKFDWGESIWSRKSGSDQSLIGDWVLDTDEFTFRSDNTTTYRIAFHDIPGLLDTFGNKTSGDLVYWEQRAQIVAVAANSQGSFVFTAHSQFGGTHTFTLQMKKRQMVLTNAIGDVFKYDAVDCDKVEQ